MSQADLPLTRKQERIFELMVDAGMKPFQISVELGMSPHTVQTHILRAKVKLKAATTCQACAFWALRRGVIG